MVVVGGGISGLAAAHRLVTAGVRVTLVEASERVGGKLHTGEIAGVPVDLGAESMLARRPEGIDLARAAGLGDRLRPPATATASIWTRGALRPMPQGHVMGVPATPDSLAGLLSPEGVERIGRERDLPPAAVGDDVAVGTYVAERLGREVVDRLVEPLLGGVYAGDAYRISLAAAVPQLFAAARGHGHLLDAVDAVRRETAARQADGPVFLGIDGGVGTLPLAVAAAVRAHGGTLLTSTRALGLARVPGGWRVRTEHGVLEADGVVLAAPAWTTAELLAAESPVASAEIGRIEYASMALVTLAFRRSDTTGLPEGSGFLVPPVDGRTIKASTFSSRKWSWVDKGAPDLVLLRASIGRYGEEEQLERDDADLVRAALTDLGAATGLAARPLATEVTRWIGGLPQYPVGHRARVARVRAEVAKLPGLTVCGAAYDGVGIPACVADGRRAAEEILATPTLARGTDHGAGQ
ncbi:protoporphyrinogen oxidase [Streptomyces clavuligerus]|nr:protoporphyrinogen oxidase [Streptomyces clavuligerus]EDY52584.1 protoporphyrinogen oxidase [Streptomyces clavuligerus]MBY6301978.1 protoporphyrinogen oxidase [Streptomyces clavuligerus]QPL66431.1 protoporphyrinogen oxidase [Streptomyces clavuligerus]QPL72464.1 protoporphyrinogen oxidase [Streptomyces clavuligerus]